MILIGCEVDLPHVEHGTLHAVQLQVVDRGAVLNSQNCRGVHSAMDALSSSTHNDSERRKGV